MADAEDPLAELPDEVRSEIQEHLDQGPATLDAIGLVISQRRAEAKAARTGSGIEQTWKEAEEAYAGIDDANRGEFQDARWSKPWSMSGPVTTSKTPIATDHKSTAFLRLTARYTDAGAAKLAEILLPIDDKSFKFNEMPVPALLKAKEDNSQVVHDGMNNIPLTRAAKPEELPPQPSAPLPALGVGSPAPAAGPAPAVGAVPPAGAVAAPPQVPLTVADLAQENIEQARKQAKAAEQRVYDWMVACQHQAEMRKVIFDAARLGVGIVKGPVPKSKRGIVVRKDGPNGLEIEIKDSIKPSDKWVNPWNIFPDPACGENVGDGEWIFERDWLSERALLKLKDIPGYIGSQIDKVVAEGPEDEPASKEQTSQDPTKAKRKGRFEIWYFYGTLKREDMDTIDAAAGKPVDPSAKKLKPLEYVILTVVKDHVIRATINPLDSGEIPYHSMPWQRRADSWAGIGVPEQLNTPQKMLNAGVRAMLNNAGKSAGSQIVVDRSQIQPADGKWIVTPDKIWWKKGDSPGADVRQAFMAINIPNVTTQLMEIVQFAERMAEESTSIPLVTQGQSGATTPETLGAVQLQDTNANQLLRSIGYTFDECITEPLVRQYYEWLLLDPDVPDEEKGEFEIDAHGSDALVERAIQVQRIQQMGPMSLNPAYGLDPKKYMTALLKASRLDPADLQYTPEDLAKMAAAPPPEAPVITVAKIGQQTALETLTAKQSADQRTAANETSIEQAAQALAGKKIETDQNRDHLKATVALHDMAERRDLAMLEYANRHQISLDQAKTDLAKTAMTLQTQKQLNATDNAVALHQHHVPGAPKPERPNDKPRGPKPLAQTPGRAPNGRALAQ